MVMTKQLTPRISLRGVFLVCAVAAAGLTAPEFQIAHETTVTGYANFMYGATLGESWIAGGLVPDYQSLVPLAGTADALVAQLDLMLTAGRLSDASKTLVRDAVNTIEYDGWMGPERRIAMAVQMILASPDFIVQQ